MPLAIRLILTPIAFAALAGFAWATEPVRSVASPRRLAPDRLRAPRSSIRVTHRGWEYKHQQFTVVAPTQVLAEQTANQFSIAWRTSGRLVGRFTRHDESTGFATNSTLVFVDRFGGDEGRESQSYAVGRQHVVHVSGRGSQSSGQFQDELRQVVSRGAAEAFLHATELDASWPQWLQDGLCRAVGRLADPSSNPGNAKNNDWVRFLLDAEGGKHASGLFHAIQSQDRDGRLERLRADLAPQFATWAPSSERILRVKSLARASENSSVEVDMLTVLRLLERWSPAVERQTSSAPTGIKIVRPILPSSREDAQTSANDLTPTSDQSTRNTLPRAISLSEFQRRFLGASWSAKIGSTWREEADARGIVFRLGLNEGRTRWRRTPTGWRLETDIANSQRILANWIAENGGITVTFESIAMSRGVSTDARVEPRIESPPDAKTAEATHPAAFPNATVSR